MRSEVRKTQDSNTADIIYSDGYLGIIEKPENDQELIEESVSISIEEFKVYFSEAIGDNSVKKKLQSQISTLSKEYRILLPRYEAEKFKKIQDKIRLEILNASLANAYLFDNGDFIKINPKLLKFEKVMEEFQRTHYQTKKDDLLLVDFDSMYNLNKVPSSAIIFAKKPFVS